MKSMGLLVFLVFVLFSSEGMAWGDCVGTEVDTCSGDGSAPSVWTVLTNVDAKGDIQCVQCASDQKWALLGSTYSYNGNSNFCSCPVAKINYYCGRGVGSCEKCKAVGAGIGCP